MQTMGLGTAFKLDSLQPVQQILPPKLEFSAINNGAWRHPEIKVSQTRDCGFDSTGLIVIDTPVWKRIVAKSGSCRFYCNACARGSCGALIDNAEFSHSQLHGINSRPEPFEKTIRHLGRRARALERRVMRERNQSEYFGVATSLRTTE